MSDIFSLACIFLDIITFVVKGKINDFVKFRTNKISSPLQRGRRTRTDSSFHADPDKIDAWIDVLKEDSEKRNEKVFTGVPAMLKLVRSMMVQNATLRPTAAEVRNCMREIMQTDCGTSTLCCADREWATEPLPEKTKHVPRSQGRDSISVATGLYNVAAPARNGSESARGGAQKGEPDRNVLSRAESSTMSTKSSRRRSSASTATAKMSWKRAFSSSSKGA